MRGVHNSFKEVKKSFERVILDKKWDEIANRYPIVLKDKERFKELSQKRAYIDENNAMYIFTSKVLNLAPEYAATFSPVALTKYLNKFEIFVEKWKTRPISYWLFNTEIGDLKEGMEKLFDSISQYHVIKIYPWTTKEEVKAIFASTFDYEDMPYVTKPKLKQPEINVGVKVYNQMPEGKIEVKNPEFTVNVPKTKQVAPVVNVNVEPTPVKVDVKAPDITVNMEVPEQPAPEVNVDVEFPKVIRERQEVNRDKQGFIESVDGEMRLE